MAKCMCRLGFPGRGYNLAPGNSACTCTTASPEPIGSGDAVVYAWNTYIKDFLKWRKFVGHAVRVQRQWQCSPGAAYTRLTLPPLDMVIAAARAGGGLVLLRSSKHFCLEC